MVVFALPLMIAALAAPEPDRAAMHPLRTLVYRFNYGVSTLVENRGPIGDQSGMSRFGPPPPPVGPVKDAESLRTTNSGTLRVDVITLRAGVLVVDEQLDGTERSQPPLRVAIFPNGLLTYDPKRQLAPEARLLLPLFSGKFFGDRAIDRGDQWSMPWLAPSKGETRYTVAAIDGDLATLHLEGAGSQGNVSRQDSATMTYETRQLDPVHYEYTGTDRDATTLAAYRVDHIVLDAELISDTFAKAP
jgi:hypothetical protein